jgi:hypothetical protein
VATSASVKLPGNRLGLARGMGFTRCNFGEDKADTFYTGALKNQFMWTGVRIA